MKLSTLLFSAVLATAMVAGAAAAELKPGDPAPAFSMQGSDGKMHTLADYKGKKAVVIAWFPKAFTGGCTKECKSMRADGDALRKFDVAYFTASCDTPDKNKAFAESLELDYPILSDPTHDNATAFGVLGPKGNAQRWTFYIDKDGKIAEIDKKVKTETHGQDIAGKLKELGVAQK
ncbi:MAG TPA: peroxiredoxin [Pirellulales bacterium]|jgi:peroxiredoxin Q/BCP|nr:peroxiredoxin [Pirellulales bacterium]